MQIPPGTTYTITDGFNIAVILLLEQSHSLAGKDMQGIWNTHSGGTGHLMADKKGSWNLVFFPAIGIGHALILYNEKGRQVLMINAGGTRGCDGNGYLFGPVGKKGFRVKGYSNIPLCNANKLWFGFGMKWGGQLGPLGAELTIAAMINVGTRQTTILQLQGIKAGLGLGGSASLTCIMAFNYATPQSMNGATNDGFDFALSLGEKWDGILKNLENAPRYSGWLGKLPDECRYFEQAEVVAQRLKKVENLANWAKILASFSNVPASGNCFVAFDIPGAGTGLEVGMSYGVTTIISVDGIDAPTSSLPPPKRLPGAYKGSGPEPTRLPSGLGRRDW